MTRSLHVVLIAAVSIAPLGGCANNEGTYGLGGAAMGAVACGLIGGAIFKTAAGAAGSAAACGAAGYFVGSAIGRQLDERDRTRANAATQQALEVPVRTASYSTVHTNVVHPKVRAVTWNSDHGTGNSGSADVVAVEPQKSGGECRTVREVAYIKGQETQQESRYCKSPSGDWAAA